MLRVATFQRKPLFDDVPRIVKRLHRDLTLCDNLGVNLAVFPECYLQGYDYDKEVLIRRALALGSDVFNEILETLLHIRTTLVFGVIERRGNSLYNTAAVIHAGTLLGTYSKTHPNEKAFEAGSEYPVFDVSGWPFGINICYDANFPEAALRISRQGARLLCYPLNNMMRPLTAEKWRSKSLDNLRQRATETGCWVVSSDVVGQHNDLISYGCTCIINPKGQLISRAAEEYEGIALADLS